MKKKALVPLLISLLIGIEMADPVWADDASDAKDPTKERYCDPVTNADGLAKIQDYQNQINALNSGDPKGMELMKKISQINRNLSCVYRTIQ